MSLIRLAYMSAAILLTLTGGIAHAHALPLAQNSSALMAPHKALYNLRMSSRHSGSQVLDLRGQMMFEWRPVCGAFTTNHNFDLDYEYADSAPLKITSDFTTYETQDGREFDFISRRHRDGQLYEELRGHGQRARNGSIKVAYTTPPDLSFDIKPGSLFPMAHTRELLRAIREKKKIFHAVVFDGSDNEGPVEINAVISGPAPDFIFPAAAEGGTTPPIDVSLLQSPAWNVRMAFFPLNSDEAQSDYEMDVVMLENGIIRSMDVHYSDFSVTQKLVALEKLPGEDCAGLENDAQNGGKGPSLWDKFFSRNKTP